MAEPPGIFIGRGAHPLRGKWKRRITHEDVILNMGKDAKIPFGKWGKICTIKKLHGLASWVDDLTKNIRMVCRYGAKLYCQGPCTGFSSSHQTTILLQV